MPRPAKPYLSRGWYVTNIDGKRRRLCPAGEGRKAADTVLVGLGAERESNGGHLLPDLIVPELVALFLESVKVERSESTYLDYQRWLTEFAKRHGNRPVRDVSRLDAQRFKNDLAQTTFGSGHRPLKTYKPKTINHALISLKRCWNWGIESKVVPPKNPFARLPLLHAEGRQRVMTDDEFRSLLRNSTDSCFRRLLIALRFTSARPGEVRNLTWQQVDWENHRWVIYRHKSSRTAKVSKPKIIPMRRCVENLLRWLYRRNGQQPYVFLNSLGKPWT